MEKRTSSSEATVTARPQTRCTDVTRERAPRPREQGTSSWLRSLPRGLARLEDGWQPRSHFQAHAITDEHGAEKSSRRGRCPGGPADGARPSASWATQHPPWGRCQDVHIPTLSLGTVPRHMQVPGHGRPWRTTGRGRVWLGCESRRCGHGPCSEPTVQRPHRTQGAVQQGAPRRTRTCWTLAERALPPGLLLKSRQSTQQ